jgi:hypothetical protein
MRLKMVKCGNCGCNIDAETGEFFFAKGAESMESLNEKILLTKNENTDLHKEVEKLKKELENTKKVEIPETDKNKQEKKNYTIGDFFNE